MTQKQITPNMKRTYEYICNFIREKGYSPSTREIVRGVPLSSTSVASYHRDQLVKHKLLGFTQDRARGIELYGSLTLTFLGADAEFIRENFGTNPENEMIQRLREEVGVMEYGT